MPKGYMYILECSDGSYYTGSTKDLERRLQQHQSGEGANHTKKHLPVKLVYFEEFDRIDHAFYREKQVQGWSRKKKEALINGDFETLHNEAECKNKTHHGGFGSAQPPVDPKPLVERSRNEGYKKTKLGWIPEGWKFTKLGNLGQFLKGKGIAKSEVIEDGIPCVRYGEIYTNHNDYIKAFTSFTTQKSANQSTKLEYGDILFAGSGETLEDIGKSVAFVDEFEAYAGGDIIILRGHNQDPKFVGFLLNTDFVSRQTFQLGQGHSVVHIYSSGLKNVKIPLPPLPEQQKIATILSTWDKAIDKLTQLISTKEQRKKGLMQLLLTGKKRFAGFKDEWKEGKLGEVFEINAGKDLKSESFSEVITQDYKFPVYSNKLTNNGLYGFYKTFDYSAYKITVTARGSLGYAFPRFEDFMAIGRLLVLTPKIELDISFVSEFINNIIEIHIESTGVPQLTAPQFSIYKLKLPLLQEQQKIASVLSAADKEIELLKNELERFQQQKKGLMQVLLTGEVRVKIN